MWKQALPDPTIFQTCSGCIIKEEVIESRSKYPGLAHLMKGFGPLKK